jgi:hypothetical protein
MRFEMYAAASNDQEGVFYDFASEEDSFDVRPTILMPTAGLVEDYVENYLSHFRYSVVKVIVFMFNEHEMSYTVLPVDGEWGEKE